MNRAQSRGLQEAAEIFDRSKRYFDIEAMKRRFGSPPVLALSGIASFDEFIVALANCMGQGDSVIAILIYQYGLEQYKILELLRWRVDAINAQHTMGIQKKVLEADGTRKSDAPQMENANREPTGGSNDRNNGEEVTNGPLSVHLVKSRGLLRASREIGLAGRFERGLDNYARIDRLILECSKRAKALMRQIENHSRYLAERLDLEFWAAAIDAIQYAPIDDAEFSTDRGSM